MQYQIMAEYRFNAGPVSIYQSNTVDKTAFFDISTARKKKDKRRKENQKQIQHMDTLLEVLYKFIVVL